MTEPQIIHLSDVTYNAINTRLLYIILAICGYIIMKNYSDIYFKMNPNEQKFTLDITYFISNAQNTERFLHDYIRKIVSEVVKKKTTPINNNLNNRDTTIQYLDDAVNKLDKKLLKENTKKIIDYQQNYLSMDNSVTTLNNAIKQMNDIQKSNIEAVDRIYEKYSKSMQDYLYKLLNVMSIINYHVNITYIKPSMQVMIDPLKTLYNSIYNSLINNADFLKKFIPEYNPASIPKLQTKIGNPQNLQADFKTSSEIMNNNGY